MKHPACGKFLAENDITKFYEPSMDFKQQEFDKYKVIVAVPKDENKRPAFLILNDNKYIYESSSVEDVYYRLLIMKKAKEFN